MARRMHIFGVRTWGLIFLQLWGWLPGWSQVVNPPPAPYWLARPPGVERGSGGVFKHRFEFPEKGRLLKAIALVACDPGAKLILNGKEWTVKPSAELALGHDVSAFVKQGMNEIEVRCEGGKSAPVMALRLELNLDGEGQRWVITDGSWRWKQEGEWSEVAARVVLRVDDDGGMNPFDPQKSVDAYNSWKLALKPGEATPAEGFVMPPGFRAERIRSAAAEEGSWIAMAFDRDGSLVLARERRGLIRLDLSSNRVDRVRVVEDTLLECRGLVFVGGNLYANANNSKKLCRLGDGDGDGVYERVEELLVTEGGVGHGRNHLKLGPDGWLYVAHGNNVKLPSGGRISARSPFRGYGEDQLQPCLWDAGMFDGDVTVPAGHVLRVHPETGEVQLYAGGFRNPMDVAFNADGEMFTFDADMEWDIGAPWYMPNRVLHVISGGEYGFRRGTGRFPVDWPDTLPSVVNIGLASPTAVTFGIGARFPEVYRKALYVCDWAYGRILAVHLESSGGSYTGRFEDFVTGRPLNVTDLCIGPDGAMWFITGGRGTQSGLYRVIHDSRGGGSVGGIGEVAVNDSEAALRRWRRELEGWHGGTNGMVSEGVLDKIWLGLGHGDRHVRYAARVALEAVDGVRWKGRLWEGGGGMDGARGEAALALARAGGREDQEALWKATIAWAGMKPDAEDKLRLLRIWTLSGARHGMPSGQWVETLRGRVEEWFPSEDMRVNRLAGAWLRATGSGRLLPGTMEMLRRSTRGEEWLMGTFWIRDLEVGWTMVDQVRFLEALRSAQGQQGGKAYFQSLDRIRQEFLERRTVEERESLRHWLVPEESVVVGQPEAVRVREWRMEDLEGVVGGPQDSSAGSRLRGRLAFVRAQCGQCHRVGQAAGGQGGPDLAGVGGRFGRRDLLRHVLEPSLVVDEKFRGTLLELKDGQEWTGVVLRETGEELVLAGHKPGETERRIRKEAIRTRRVSEISPMPTGLIDVLTEEEVGELLNYLQSR